MEAETPVDPADEIERAAWRKPVIPDEQADERTQQ